ncbi:MAG TPA: GTP cyclohydrolase I [Candidatus Obscuribacterales bacterium]
MVASLRIDPDDPEFYRGMELNRRDISEEQMHKFEVYVSEIFSAFGMDMTLPSTERTPERYVKALLDATIGYDGDPKLITAFDTECRGEPACLTDQIIEGPIPFYALCEHHALPFHGHAYVGYIPCKKIIGISKLTRLVRVYARRFTVQERIGKQIIDTLAEKLDPHGIAIYLGAHHLCMQMRGVRASVPLTKTTFWHGEYTSNNNLRSEFLALCGVPE